MKDKKDSTLCKECKEATNEIYGYMPDVCKDCYNYTPVEEKPLPVMEIEYTPSDNQEM